MKMLIKAIVSIILCLQTINLNAQGIQSTQFEQSPLTLNPSLSGVFNGNLRTLLNYKAYRSKTTDLIESNTASASIDKSFKLGENFIGFGFIGQIDRLSNYFSQSTKGGVSLSYIKLIGTSHLLSIGQNINFIDRVNEPSFTVIETNQDSTNLKTNLSYFNFTSGLYWLTHFQNRNSINLGLALRNINRPDISLFNDSINKLPIGIVIHGGAEISLSSTKALEPSFIYNKLYDGNLQFGIGIKLYKSTENDSNFLKMAFHLRNSNNGYRDVIVIAQGALGRFNIGFSYEIIPIQFVDYFSETVFEASIGYRFGLENKFGVLR
jgi:type IX secretion system PorP/SprF family membrane protein